MLGVALACAGEPSTGIDKSPIAGLAQGQATDSAGGTVNSPPPTSTTSPGYVHGTVRAPTPNAPPHTDTLANSVKIAGAVVTAYRYAGSTDAASLGTAVAQVVTDADGKFTLPTVPGGDYLVTFNPPESLKSVYGGVWTIGPIHDKSHQYPWWITLWKK